MWNYNAKFRQKIAEVNDFRENVALAVENVYKKNVYGSLRFTVNEKNV